MTKKICNWCAEIADAPDSDHWLAVTLTLEGLEDGSVSWLPEKTLHFCTKKSCAEQVERCEAFLDEMPDAAATLDPSEAAAPGVLRVRLQITDTPGRAWFDVAKQLSHRDAALDVQALARFFHETSHPKLRRRLEAFEEQS